MTGKLDLDVADWALKEALSAKYGWTPAQIDKMDWKAIAIYAALIKGQDSKPEFKIGGAQNRNMRN